MRRKEDSQCAFDPCTRHSRVGVAHTRLHAVARRGLTESAEESPSSGTTFKLLHDRPGFEEEFADPLEEEDGTVGGFRHEFYPCFPPCAFMAAGSVAERERFQPRNGLQPLLRAGCKGVSRLTAVNGRRPVWEPPTATSCQLNG